LPGKEDNDRTVGGEVPTLRPRIMLRDSRGDRAASFQEISCPFLEGRWVLCTARNGKRSGGTKGNEKGGKRGYPEGTFFWIAGGYC